MGISNSVISNREMYRRLYIDKWDKVMVRETGELNYHLYKAKTKYYAYIKIPSETIKDFYYDVIIEFTPPEEGIKNDTTLKNYHVRFYSNDPAFVFTFAHAFIKNGMFINQYKDKMSNLAIEQVAKEKNPHNQVGYVKSLYFAYLGMTKRGLFNKIRYVEKYNEDHIKEMIMPADMKITLRQEAQKELPIKRKKKHNLDRDQYKDTNTLNNIPIVGSINKSKNITKTKVVKKINSGIKKTKRI